jgi:hypothetical protein
MYQDADEVESFGVEAPVLSSRFQALLEHLCITTAPRYRIKEVPHSGQVVFKAVATCSRRLALLIHEEQLRLLKNLVLKVLEQRFRYNVTGARAALWKPGVGGAELGGGGAR